MGLYTSCSTEVSQKPFSLSITLPTAVYTHTHKQLTQPSQGLKQIGNVGWECKSVDSQCFIEHIVK